MSIQVQGSPRWLHRPLCRKYVVGAFKAFHVPKGHRPNGGRWHWALGVCASGEFEVLGAWSLPGGDFKLVAHDLAERGTERIQLVCMDETADMALPAVDMTPVDRDLASSSLQVEGYVSATRIATRLAPGKQRALLSAVALAKQLHGRLVRAVWRHGPFESDESAEAFVSQWLQRADLSLIAPLSPIRRANTPTWALSSPRAPRATTN